MGDLSESYIETYFTTRVAETHSGSPALFQNAEASYDFSSNDPFPYPRYTDDWFNR